MATEPCYYPPDPADIEATMAAGRAWGLGKWGGVFSRNGEVQKPVIRAVTADLANLGIVEATRQGQALERTIWGPGSTAVFEAGVEMVMPSAASESESQTPAA